VDLYVQLVIVRDSEISRIAKDRFVYSSGTFAVLFISSETLEKDLHLKDKIQKYLSFH
jgi:hypothetical protein